MAQPNHALAPAVIPNVQFETIQLLVEPQTVEESANSNALDFKTGTGNVADCFVTLAVGTIGGTGTPSVAVTIQQSHQLSTDYTDVASFATRTTSGVETIKFSRTKQYVRVAITVTGTDPTVPISVTIGY